MRKLLLPRTAARHEDRWFAALSNRIQALIEELQQPQPIPQTPEDRDAAAVRVGDLRERIATLYRVRDCGFYHWQVGNLLLWAFPTTIADADYHYALYETGIGGDLKSLLSLVRPRRTKTRVVLGIDVRHTPWAPVERNTT